MFGQGSSIVYNQLQTTPGLESMAQYLNGDGIFQYVQKDDLKPESFWQLIDVAHKDLG